MPKFLLPVERFLAVLRSSFKNPNGYQKNDNSFSENLRCVPIDAGDLMRIPANAYVDEIPH